MGGGWVCSVWVVCVLVVVESGCLVCGWKAGVYCEGGVRVFG